MIYLLLAAIISFGLAWWLHKQTEKSADDWIGEFVSLILVVAGAVLFIVYLAAAFWNHRFW